MRAAPTCSWRRLPPPTQGDVLVIDNGGRHDEGCIGDLVVGEAFMSGIAGTVCWGTHRDTGAILAIGARVWSLGTCPNGPLELRRRHATALEAANLGSVTVTLEDYVFADDDGVVVVTTSDLNRIVETAKDIASREGAQAARLLQGRAAQDTARSRRVRGKAISRFEFHLPRSSEDIRRRHRDLTVSGGGRQYNAAAANSHDPPVLPHRFPDDCVSRLGAR